MHRKQPHNHTHTHISIHILRIHVVLPQWKSCIHWTHYKRHTHIHKHMSRCTPLIFPMGHTHTHTHTLSLSHTHTLQSKDKRLAITETWNRTPPINITILCMYANQWSQKRNSYNEGTKGDRSPLPMTAALWNISVAQACHKTWGDHNLEEKRGHTQLIKICLNLPRNHTHTHTHIHVTRTG